MKTKPILCIALALGISLFSTAQKTAIKFAPAGIAFGKATFGGEFKVGNKKSLTLVAGIPFDKTLRYELDDKKESITHKTFSLMGGYRMYLGGGNMKGLYFEPYLKYLKHEASFQVTGDIQGTSRDFATTSDYSAIGVGGQLGVQFVIAKVVALDFYFLGPEANSAKHTIVMQELGNGPAWNAQAAADAEQELRDTFEDVPIIGNKLEITANSAQKSITSKYNGFLPGIRFGLSIGVCF